MTATMADGGGADTGAAVDFLRQLLGVDAPWPLIAIAKDAPIRAATFSPAAKREIGVPKWIRRWNDDGYDIYFAVNPLKKALGKKATKDDVAAAAYLWIDLDPRKGEDPAAEQAALDRAFDGERPPGIPVPTWEVDSGRGRWAFWRLRENVPVDGENGAATLGVEGRGRGIERAFSKNYADNCRNIERIARLPGTVNHKTGRRACVTAHRPEAVYVLSDFPFVEGERSSKANGHDPGAAGTINLDAPLPVDIDALPVSARVKNMILTGENTEEPAAPFANRRSERAFTVLVAMAAAGCDDATMAAVMLDPALPIGQHVRDQRNCRQYLARQIGNARDRAAVDDDIARLNTSHAVLPVGGKTRVVRFGEMEEFPGRSTIVMTQTFGDFVALQNKYRHEYIDKDGKIQSIPLGSYWVSSPHRRQYDNGMAFMPCHDDPVVGGRLNLWCGYGVKPIKPDGKSGAAGCDKFLSLMHKVICGGNGEHFDYLEKREAFILQKRKRTEIALGLHTLQEGAGKGFYEKHMGHLLGNHAMQVTNPRHVIGNFNPHLETLLRLTADEALFVGNPEHRNALFGLITEPKLTIEPKGCGVYPADNYLNISITSNHEHFVPVSGTARRFFVPTVSPAHMQDFDYFRAIEDQLRNDYGYEALLYHMLHEVDLKDFDVRKVPRANDHQPTACDLAVPVLIDKRVEPRVLLLPRRDRKPRPFFVLARHAGLVADLLHEPVHAAPEKRVGLHHGRAAARACE
jgi:hypothetical protein